MSQQIRTMRWKLFGHILRLPKITPPRRIMEIYMQKSENTPCKRGGQYLTIARLLHRELRPVGRTFNNLNDLKDLRRIAKVRSEWNGLREAIEAEWERTEKLNEAKRKLVILLTPTRTRRKEEEIRVSPHNEPDNEDQGERQIKRQRKEFIIKISKRNVEAYLKSINEDDDDDTEMVRLWKRNREEVAPPPVSNNSSQDSQK